MIVLVYVACAVALVVSLIALRIDAGTRAIRRRMEADMLASWTPESDDFPPQSAEPGAMTESDG